VLWDDALFFQRVAYNVIQHGFAGWNQSDGPVFVNTSQLFQLFATGLYWLFPHHYGAAVAFWGALALSACLPLLAMASRAPPLGVVLLFCLLAAPPMLLSITTGMETPTALLVLAVFTWVALGERALERRAASLVALTVAVYTVRPDAVLLSLGLVVGLGVGRISPRRLLAIALASLLAIALVSLGFRAYYGTLFPLSTFLKVSPLSSYDSAYLSLDRTNKLKNLTQIGWLLLPLVPLLRARRDRENLALCAASLAFIAFHALTTYEIAAYHARFYAPLLVFVFAAALRGTERLGPAHARALLAWGAAAVVLLAVLYFPNGIENTQRTSAATVTLLDYARYALGVPLLGVALLYRRGQSRTASPPPPTIRSEARSAALLLALLTALETLCGWPRVWGITSDEASHASVMQSQQAVVGLDVIQRCFPEPFQLTHSEIGLPGVVFPESRIIDLTGLANPSIVGHRFDFDAMCRRDRPEFVYRPHPTHRALNQTLDQSRCLAEDYVSVPQARKSSCPLLVRKDLVARYLGCEAANGVAPPHAPARP
jgi:hypothetical protein